MRRSRKILYCGDSPVGGPANYLLGLLRYHRIKTIHIAPDQKLSPKDLQGNLGAVIFSDYSRKQVSELCQRILVSRVSSGLGFLMVGGWGSFSGPFGGWRGSLVETILPVDCLSEDDRKNFPEGALIFAEKDAKKVFGNLSFSESPVVCGINRVRAKPFSKTLLTLRALHNRRGKVRLTGQSYPLFVTDANLPKRVGALTTDFAPHWCGGLVDWGKKTVKIKVADKIQIEVGNLYTDFAGKLLDWLLGG